MTEEPDPSKALFRRLCRGYNGSFWVVHSLTLFAVLVAPLWFFADGGPEDRRVRTEGRRAPATIVSAEDETFLLFRKRRRLRLEVREAGKTYAGSAAVLRERAFETGRTVQVCYRPDQPERMAVAKSRSVLEDACLPALIGIVGEAALQLLILGMAAWGISILRRGRLTVGTVKGEGGYKGIPYRTATIEVEGKPISTLLVMPFWAREPGRYVFAYLPGKPKKMVPVQPADPEPEWGNPGA